MAMVDRLERLQQTVEELTTQLRNLEARVGTLEERPASAPPVGSPVDDEIDDLELPKVALPQGTLALLGRTLLVLAGGFLVRALTDGRVLPAGAGIALGLAYAVFWQLLAYRDARAGRRESATFYGLASSLIAFPLIWETTARFGLLGPRAAAAALVGFFALALWMAWRGQLAVNAGLATGLALATAVALLVSTHDLLATLLTLVAIAAGLEWLAWRDWWRPLRWPAAAVLDGVAVLLIVVMTRSQGMPDGYVSLSAPAAAGALLALPFLYIVSLAVRTVVLARPITPFGVTQGSLSVLLGFGGAWRVLDADGHSTTVLGILAVLLGVLCYATAFAFAERRAGQARNFYFYATAGGLLILAGTSALGLGSGLAFVWAGLGLAAALLGRRFDRMTLRAHSALYFVAAGIQTGLVAGCVRALAGRAADPVPAVAWGAAVAAVAAYLLLATDPRAPRSGWGRIPQLLLALLVVLTVVRSLQLGAWAALGDVVPGDPGLAATILTAILAAVVLGLAWAARRGRQPELGWLVYPLVAVGGLKLLLRDLPQGRPATLVLSLALYGAVLILVPWLLKSREE
jgi:hypothetical protein